MLPIDTHLRDVEVTNGGYLLDQDEIYAKLKDTIQYVGQYLMNAPECIVPYSQIFPSLVRDGYGGIYVSMELREDNELKLLAEWKFK